MKKTAMVSALAAGVLSASIASAETTKVGVLLPFSGVYAALGKEIDAGFALGMEEFGSGLDIEYVREDSEADPGKSVAKARKLVLQDKVDVMTGLVSSAVAGALRDFVHGAKVPLLITNAGDNSVTGAKCSPYISRFSFSNGQINRPMGTWMAQNGIKKVYTLAPDYTAGREMIEGFVGTFEAAGGEIVCKSFFGAFKQVDLCPYGWW